MTKYFIPTRYDAKTADHGVWFEVYDEHNNLYGKFLCALIDKHSQRTIKAYERFNKRYQRLKNTPGFKDRAAADLFVELSLIDWELKGANGKSIAYEASEAVAYLSEVPFVLDALDRFASDVTNYSADPEQTPEKN